MNRFSLFLVLIAVALIASVASAGKTTCAYYSNGHIIGHSGVQYQVLTPGDYKLNDHVRIRQTQCPGAEEGVVCVTAVNIDGTEYHYNAEANILESTGGQVTEFTGHEQGYYVKYEIIEETYHLYFFPNAQAVFTEILDEDEIEKFPELGVGLCGNYLGVYRNYDYETPNYPVDLDFNKETEEYEDTLSKVKFNVVNATQEEIEEFAQTWTAARLDKATLINGHVADVNYGDFAAFESTTVETTELNDFFIHHHLCSADGDAFSLRGLYKDYTDYEHCAHHNEENTVMHIFKKDFISGESELLVHEEKINFQKYWEDYLEDESFLTDGKSKTAINLWAKIGGKYNFVTKYDNLCGQEVSFNTAVDIQCNQAPSVDIREDLSVSSGDYVVLHANMTDPEEDDLVVSWKIIEVPEQLDEDEQVFYTVPSAEWGYDDHYFAFQTIENLVGTYVVEVAVSDYCNVVYNTVKVEVRCEECSDTRINLESSTHKLRLNGKSNEYQETELNFFTSDENPVDVQSVKITPRDTDTYYFLDDGESNIKIYSNEAVAETKDPVEESKVNQVCNFEEIIIDSEKEIGNNCEHGVNNEDCEGIYTDVSFKRSLLIPTLNRRGYVVIDEYNEDYNGDLNDLETDKFRRVQDNIVHHRVVCVGGKTTENTTTTVEVFETPAQYLCELDYVQEGTEVDLTLAKQANVRDQCNMVFHVNATGEIGDCNRPLVSTVFPLTSDCPQPEANPRCPHDTYEYEYKDITDPWPEIELSGKDSHDGTVYDVNDALNLGDNIDFKWTIVSKPEYADAELDDDAIMEPKLTLSGRDIEGQYTIELRVDNSCLNDTREIVINAICPLPAPTATIDVAEGSNDNTVDFTVNDYDHEYHNSKIHDIQSVYFEAHVTSYPRSKVDDLFEEISEFYNPGENLDNIRPVHGRYGILDPQEIQLNDDEDVDAPEVPFTGIQIGSIPTNGGLSYRPEGDYQVTARVTDGCKHVSEQSDIGVVCVGDALELEITNTDDTTTNPDYQITFTTNAQHVRYCIENDNGKDCNAIPGGDTSFSPDFALGTNRISVIGFNNDVCETVTDTYTIAYECADVSFDMSPSSRSLKSQRIDEHDIVITDIQVDGTDDMDQSPQICILNDVGDCIDNYFGVVCQSDDTVCNPHAFGETGIEVRIIHFAADADEDLTDRHYKINIGGSFMEIGQHKFNVRISTYDCGEKVFTLNVDCIDDVTSQPAEIETVTYTHNGFPSVGLSADLQNVYGLDNEDKLHPDEDLKYFWEFVAVPENSAYFAFDIEEQVIGEDPETVGTTVEYITPAVVGADEPAAFKERETTVMSESSVKLRRTLKRSVINSDGKIDTGDVAQFSNDHYYIAHRESLPGCFTPDVAGTYELELKTAFSETRIRNQCPIPASRVTVTAECNAAPSVEIVGANDEGVIEVDITRDSYDYSRVVVSLEASDADNDHLSIEWSWTGGIMEGRPGAERELRESGLDADDTLDNELRYAIVDGHSRDPSFLVGVAGDYKLTVAVDDGCTRVTRDVIVRVGCGGSQFSATADDVTHSFQYRSVVDIDQFAFSTVPSTSGDYFCQNPLFKSVEVKSWDLPDQFSSSARAVVQPIVAMVAMIFALLAIFY